ncbi:MULTISPECIES: NAD(P)-dependent oxidoreductase [Arthrobacter]|uniref:NAD(P)-dependent oxidoreductase n=2 Tax=Arthrobacter TaxID=1663 RepID=A0ABU9KHT1_9MICC|nr:NAD(P)-dependent oxidoreductase [Arthrobacter sp. YJM1]MDP5225705.1 NAD(P)-dependent oxidoreductase [Arthrobacter sp. YJM1]
MNASTAGTEHAGPFATPGLRVLLLGSTGFVGCRVAASLLAAGGIRLVTMSRRTLEPPPFPHATTLVGDLRDPGAVANALHGVDVVINAASYVGRDAALAREVNVTGTRNLLAGCRSLGIRRVIQLSTTSVYGSGLHRGITEDGAGYHPQSAASAGRAVAEAEVLDFGGTVVRPNLVFGIGDRWVIPGIVRMMRAGRWPGDGSARLSMIDVGALGRILASLALSDPLPGRAFHAAASGPTGVTELLAAVERELGTPRPRFEAGSEAPEAKAALKAEGFSPHQVELVTQDHWYSVKALRAALPQVDLGPRLPDAGTWRAYRDAGL